MIQSKAKVRGYTVCYKGRELLDHPMSEIEAYAKLEQLQPCFEGLEVKVVVW